MYSGYDPANLMRIISAFESNLCLEVPGDAVAPGQMLEVWDCHGGNNQLWNYTVPAHNQCPVWALHGCEWR